MIQKPRGTMDIFPDEAAIWQYIEKTAAQTAECFGFGEIRFPTFEATELFARGVGDTTDVVQKEMYTFKDREDRSFTLRPEGTACVVRSIIENGRCSDTMPLKLYYLINCFRYEKPQAGRSREFFQFGAEMFGSPSALGDAEMISFADAFIKKLGIKGVSLRINSIGCPDCRPKYHTALKEYFASRKEELCDTCKSRLETNPMRILDCKCPTCKEIAAGAPKTIENLCDNCADHMNKLKSLLDAMDIEYTIDPSIVRGLDYYTRTVFEFVFENIGAQNTLCGGGRYDNLVSQIGGPSLPACGFAMGITRLILAMKESGVEICNETRPLLYVASMGDTAAHFASSVVSKLRSKDIHAERDAVGRSLKAQMKYADKIKAKYTLIIGDSEIEAGSAKLRNMDDGVQTDISLNDIDTLISLLVK